MAKYELSIEPEKVAEAERRVSLDGRGFPTLVLQWQSEMLGQPWVTTLVLDYSIPLPPLKVGDTFNEVRLGAYTDDVPTKFLYFGTELSEDAPRVAPEMENMVSPAGIYQEYRIDEQSSKIPYLELISTTPRIYGNAAQDYYSPPIKVERFDASIEPELIADNFLNIVANLPPSTGEVLTDPRGGFWQGSRFVGTKKIAILRHGEVVGLHHRKGRAGMEVVPPEVVRRDPHLDVQDEWVAIDFGSCSSVIAVGDANQHELLAIGAEKPPELSRDFETPSEVSFNDLPRVLQAWTDRVILPLTSWGDLWVGHAARNRHAVQGREGALRLKSTITELASLPERLDRGDELILCGRADLDDTVKLEKPAPPIIDEEGVCPDDPFDPIELYAYYIGLNVNTRARGIHLKYAIGMPTGWSQERRQQIVTTFRRGLMRSLPAGMIAFDDLEQFQVVDAGPNVMSFVTHAFHVFGVEPKGGESIRFVAIDAGASEVAAICGQYRVGSPAEVAEGSPHVLEHAEPSSFAQFGAETLLHRMAYRVYAASESSMRQCDIPFQLPPEEEILPNSADRLTASPQAQVNVRLLKNAIRSVIESTRPEPLPDLIQLFSTNGSVQDVRVLIDRAALIAWFRDRLTEMAIAVNEAVSAAIVKVTRDTSVYKGLRIFLGGRMSMNPMFQERLEAVLPMGVRFHRFREPDRTNLAAPTVKIATALGILATRQQQGTQRSMSDERTTFNYRVGRAKRGKLLTVLDPTSGYDVWVELGACTRPELKVLYTDAPGDEELAADDPAIRRVACALGYDAVGYRIYMRAVGGSSIEIAVGPPGGQPAEGGVRWGVNLKAGSAEPLSAL